MASRYSSYGFKAMNSLDEVRGVGGIYIFDHAQRGMLPYVGQAGNLSTRYLAHDVAGNIGGQFYFKPLAGNTTVREVQETIMMNNLGGKPQTANIRYPVSPSRNKRLNLGITNY